MSPRARRERGFTLTEILMAVGILGVGLTMVASIFPVAVDQSRRSRESTMAAMCARSVVAMMKARRDVVVPWCRLNAKDKTDELTRVQATSGPPPLLKGCIPGKFRVYNPDSFLYDDYKNTASKTQHRWYSTSDNSAFPPITNADATGMDRYPTWMPGNYVPVVFASPISTTTPLTGLGPWRITIVVYKAFGGYGTTAGTTPTARNLPEWLDPLNGTVPNQQYLAAWSKATPYPVRYPNRGTAGDYILDFRKTDATNPRGEAYLVDRVIPNPTNPTGANDQISLATRVTATGIAADPPITSPLTTWVGMPKAIAVFHTVIGE